MELKIIKLYKLSTRFRKSWHFSKTFDNETKLRAFLENKNTPYYIAFEIYKGEFLYDNNESFVSFYFVDYHLEKNIIVETFLQDIIKIYPWAEGLKI